MIDLVSEDNPIKPHLRGIQGLFSLSITCIYTTPTGRIPPPPDANLLSSYVKKLEETINKVADSFGVNALSKPTSTSDIVIYSAGGV
jgi:hypothetical protein